MWKRVMSFNFTLTLFRNETINIFKLAESSLDKLKSAKTIIREVEKKAQQNVPIVHKERRKYLRSVGVEHFCHNFKNIENFNRTYKAKR